MTAPETGLGLGTVWRQTRGEARPDPFARRMESLRARVDALNLDPDAVHLACEIAALEEAPGPEERISLVLLILALLAAQQEGSTRLPLSDADRGVTLRRLLAPLCEGESGDDPVAEAIAAIDALLGSERASRVIGQTADTCVPLLRIRVPKPGGGGFASFLYSQRLRLAESRLAERLAALAGRSVPPWPEKAIDDALEDIDARPIVAGGAAIRPSAEQREALRAALDSPLTIVTGGPGTGKTSIVFSLLRLLVRLGVSPDAVALAAPTGKAAYRMTESIGTGLASIADPTPEDQSLRALPEAKTLHRLLGYSPALDRYRHHRNNPLESAVVIVDESSMVDLALMERLVGAVGDRARLVLLGDANQLPSVSAGAVFRDLLPGAWTEERPEEPAPVGACVRLRESHRMDPSDPAGAAVLRAAAWINEGNADPFVSAGGAESAIPRRASPDDLAFEGVEALAPAPGALSRFLERWDTERVAGGPEIAHLVRRVYPLGAEGFDASGQEHLTRLFGHAARSRILCLTRIFERGTERVNERLHRRAAERAGRGADPPAFLAGEPVIMLHNDYDLGLYNGDQGVVLWAAGEGETPSLRVVFPRAGRYVPFDLSALAPHIELCYAMTVHKAQGSEFEVVAVILPDRDLPLLSREILYTALTRSRRSVVIVGDPAFVATAAGRPIRRFSGLTELLAETADGRPDGAKRK